MNKNSLLSMRDLSVEDIYSILDDARLFNSSFITNAESIGC